MQRIWWPEAGTIIVTGPYSLWPCDVIWWQRSGSTLVQAMACCLMAPSHYLNQCWLLISEVLSKLIFCVMSVKMVHLKLLPNFSGDIDVINMCNFQNHISNYLKLSLQNSLRLILMDPIDYNSTLTRVKVCCTKTRGDDLKQYWCTVTIYPRNCGYFNAIHVYRNFRWCHSRKCSWQIWKICLSSCPWGLMCKLWLYVVSIC